MKIALCAGGTRGDVQPIIPLALGLKARGHHVHIAAPPENRTWVEGYGISFYGLRINVAEAVKHVSAFMTPADLLKFLRLLRTGVATQLADFPRLIAGCDLVIAVSLVFGLKTIAEAMRIPYLFIATSPQVLPSSAHPTVTLKSHSLPRWVNQLDWRLADIVSRLTWMQPVHRTRRRLGLSAVTRPVWQHLMGPMALVLSDPEIAPVPPDVTLPYRQPGHLALHSTAPLPDDIERFIAAGPAPVYMGFGSMPAGPENTARLLLRAARLAGRRALLDKGWAGFTDPDPGSDHRMVKGLPHDRLFPHMAAVVHHGGAGTTATAARAGIPQIIVPHYFDQYFWAAQTVRCGIGPRAMTRRRLTAAKLAKALQEALTDPAIGRCARQMSVRLKSKKPLAETVRFIEAYTLEAKKRQVRRNAVEHRRSAGFPVGRRLFPHR